MSIKHINIFSCLGGLPFGLESTNENIDTRIMFESDQSAVAVLNNYWPEAEVYSDVDSLLQGVENDGKQKSLDLLSGRIRKFGDDWQVWRQAIRVGQPKSIIIEGMANLRSRGLITILQDLWSFGYDAEWHIISACTFDAPYKGERVWIVAHANPDGQQEGGDLAPEQGVVGKQYITHSLLDEFRAWLDRTSGEAGGTIFDQPRILRRDDGFSRRVDSTRVRLLSDDSNPWIAAFIGYRAQKIVDGEFEPMPKQFFKQGEFIRNVEKWTNFTTNCKALDDAGIEYKKKNSGMHLVIPVNDHIVDYWPSTDVFIIRGSNYRGEGVQEVLSLCSTGIDVDILDMV